MKQPLLCIVEMFNEASPDGDMMYALHMVSVPSLKLYVNTGLSL